MDDQIGRPTQTEKDDKEAEKEKEKDDPYKLVRPPSLEKLKVASFSNTKLKFNITLRSTTNLESKTKKRKLILNHLTQTQTRSTRNS